MAENYCTTNTSLAAYLSASGFILDHIQYDDNTGIFVFTPEPEALLLLAVRQFTLGQAEGNINRYQAVREDLIDRIKRGQP